MRGDDSKTNYILVTREETGFKTVKDVELTWFGSWPDGGRSGRAWWVPLDWWCYHSLVMISGKSSEGSKDLLDWDAPGIGKGRCSLKYLSRVHFRMRENLLCIDCLPVSIVYDSSKYSLHNLFKLWEMVGHRPKVNKKHGLPLKLLQFFWGVILIFYNYRVFLEKNMFCNSE